MPLHSLAKGSVRAKSTHRWSYRGLECLIQLTHIEKWCYFVLITEDIKHRYLEFTRSKVAWVGADVNYTGALCVEPKNGFWVGHCDGVHSPYDAKEAANSIAEFFTKNS